MTEKKKAKQKRELGGFFYNSGYQVKELKRFHLKGHTIGFHVQTQTLELHAK